MAKTLKELNWFSFPDGFKEQPDFTIWQAIAYILKNVPGNSHVFDDYINALGILEKEMAIDLLEYHDDVGHSILVYKDGDYQAMSHDEFVNSQYGLENISLSEGDIEEDLSLQNQNRFTFIESMVLPNILCNLLLSELEDSSTSPLKFKNIQDGFDINATRITKASLKKWKTLSNIGVLGLTDIGQVKAGRRQRSDASENQLLVMGVLMELLAKLEPETFKVGIDAGKPRINVDAFSRRLLEIVGDGSNFPGIRTVSSILKEAKKLADGELKYKT